MESLKGIAKYGTYLASRHFVRDPKTWVFGEWFGKRAGDNSTYLANDLAENHPELELYWLSAPQCDTSALDKRIHVLDYGSGDAIAVSKRAAVAVMGEGIGDLNPEIINYFGNAVKVNLWHGMMWKKVGKDAEKNRANPIVEAMREQMFHYDLFIATSEEYADHIRTGFGMKDEELIRAGQPRNSLFFQPEKTEECRKKLTERLKIPEGRFFCYLPTFRDAQTKPFSFTEIRDEGFLNWLKENELYIIQKAHAADKNSFEPGNGHIIAMSNIPAQELMAASEMLITDYSSCFFDYLLLDRPIVHYLYDYDHFRTKDRGVYYNKEEVTCGTVAETEEELIRAIRENYENPKACHALRKERREKFMTYESPDNCRKITERILEEIKKRGITK